MGYQGHSNLSCKKKVCKVIGWIFFYLNLMIINLHDHKVYFGEII
jgi:hypothetical protein